MKDSGITSEQILSERVLVKKRSRLKRIALIGFAHLLLVALVIIILLPGAKVVPDPLAFLVICGLIEILYLSRILTDKTKVVSTSWIVIIVWIVLILWEVFTTQLNTLHPVLFPAPEAVSNVFATQYVALIGHVLASLQLLAIGALIAIIAGVSLGAFIGWVRPLREVFTPIARVLAPIPSIVFAPYLVALMPTFRLASAMVIFLGLFWPTLLNTAVRVTSMNQRIIDSARMLELSNLDMVRKVILPYLTPGVINGLNPQLTSAIMMLTFAEMLGATSGMGYYIINYTNFANYTNVVAGIIVVGIVVTALNTLINLLKRKLIRWL